MQPAVGFLCCRYLFQWVVHVCNELFPHRQLLFIFLLVSCSKWDFFLFLAREKFSNFIFSTDKLQLLKIHSENFLSRMPLIKFDTIVCVGSPFWYLYCNHLFFTSKINVTWLKIKNIRHALWLQEFTLTKFDVKNVQSH